MEMSVRLQGPWLGIAFRLEWEGGRPALAQPNHQMWLRSRSQSHVPWQVLFAVLLGQGLLREGGADWD